MAGAEPLGQLRDENFHGIAARRIFRSQRCKKTLAVREHFLQVKMFKKCTLCAKQISKSKC